MAGKDIIAMTQEELKRLHVVHKTLDKSITQAEAADIIGVCLRQAQRIIRRVRLEGDNGLMHKSRGRPSNRALPERIKNKALKYYKEKYPDFGPTLASEKLFEIDKIKLNDETLRLWLIEENIPYRKRRKRPHRQWRERKHCFGEMVQMDGSHHDWFEDRGEKCVFMGYIDDATGKVYGRFYGYEGTIPAMDSFKRYIKKYGIPMSVYFDRHTTYKSPRQLTPEEEIKGITEPLSEFERALKELGVEVIHANSPQAKGRTERLFETLQDRLVKEMRLKGIKTMEEANKFLKHYLPLHNKRFAVSPLKQGNLHREIPEGTNLDGILCIKEERALRNDFTVVHNRKLYQIEDKIMTRKVTIEQRIDGSMSITKSGIPLRYKEISIRPERQKEPPLTTFRPKKKYIPPKDHPWRRFNFGRDNNKRDKQGIILNETIT